MKYDAFSRCHPAVNFIFFLGAIGMGVVIQHPAYLLAGVACAAVYYLLLNRRKGWKSIAMLLPLALLICAVNPIFNTDGERTLLYVFGRPYTLEALCYGAAVAAVFVIMMLWFGCYNAVLTSDKFTSLFGNLIPSLSLLLVMVLRMIPGFIRKTKTIINVRKSIGKGAGEQSRTKDKIQDGMTVLSVMTDWALEGSIVTADSMRARGYGVTRRTQFQIYRMTLRDWLLLVLELTLLLLTLLCGSFTAQYTPHFEFAPLNIGLYTYCVYLLLPTMLHIKEVIQWHICISKI